MADNRFKKSAEDREAQEREMQDRAATDRGTDREEETMSFRQQFQFDALPNLPEIPGYKTIWLSSTNQRDTIQARMRLGYVPVKPEEAPGFESLRLKTGEYAGMIGINEMLAFKLPVEIWQRYMTEVHYDAPLEEEGKLRAQLELMRDSHGRNLATDVGDGIEELLQPARIKPRFGT